jgi:hypothetical protein
MNFLSLYFGFERRFSLLPLFLIVSIAAQTAGAKEILPPDVYQNTLRIRMELERIRKATGKPRELRPEINIRHALPREVFFQAITFWVKSVRLCKEFRRAGHYYPTKIEITPPDKVVPGDVWVLTENARGRLSCVRRELGLEPLKLVPPLDNRKNPSDVFRSIVQANRQINLILRHKFAPGDVFAIVSLTNEYMREVLDRVAPGWRADAGLTPAYVKQKQPIDVFRQLIKCLSVIRQIAEISDIPILDFDPDYSQEILPSDVYDMASLVFSEVRHFSTLAGVRKRYRLRSREDKVPSDVFQQARWLEDLLIEFEKRTRHRTNWRASQ